MPGSVGDNNAADGILFWDVTFNHGSKLHAKLQWKQGDRDSHYDGVPVQYLTKGFGRLGIPMQPLKYVGPAGTKACEGSEVGQRRNY